MLVDLNTKDLKLKKDDMLIFDGKKVRKISKIELLKPLYDEIEQLKREIKIDKEANKQMIKDNIEDIIKGLNSR